MFLSDHGEQSWEHGDQGHASSLRYGERDAVAWEAGRRLSERKQKARLGLLAGD